MKLIGDAVNAVQRNLGALGLFVAASLALNTLVFFADGLSGIASDPANLTLFDSMYFLARGLVIVSISSAAATVAFAWMGREIDRPLWKVDGTKEALRRFFPVWFTINFMGWAPTFLGMTLAQRTSTAPLGYLLLLLSVIYALFSTPIGTCIMFHGRFRWDQFGESLYPLVKQAPKTGVVLLVTITQVGLILYLDLVGGAGPAAFDIRGLLTDYATSVVNVYIECLVFAAVWIICIIDRDTFEEVDLDF
ncbi:MAG: hypothetical protein AMXMBFR84_31510 [Candidatus Hydrogenedentota bacterium]